MKNKLNILLSILIMLFILLNGEILSLAFKNSYSLILLQVIPALLPFMLTVNYLISKNYATTISKMLYPALSKLFKISIPGSFCVLIGFLCGYPMGTKVINSMFQNQLISKKEAYYLSTFCNNCSLSFLLNYIGLNCLGNKFNKLELILIVFLPSIIVGIINKYIIKINISNESNYKNHKSDYIADSILSIIKISIYIIIFTCISIKLSLILNYSHSSKVLALILELTSGAHAISSSCSVSNCYLLLMTTIWGGICITFQSISSLKIKGIGKYYIFGKIEQVIIGSVIYFLI